MSGVLFMVVAASAAWLPLQYRRVEIPTRNWLAAWAHFDGRWYLLIARAGYGLGHGHRRSAAFFPAYPLVVRAATVFGVSFLAAGVGITLICGALAVILFRIWLSERMSRAGARAAVLTLLLYPYTFFLVGAVYADALFLAAAIGAFIAAERGRLWVAVALGAVATVARPVGIAVVVGLAALAWEQAHTQGLASGPDLPLAPGRAIQTARRTSGIRQVVIASLAASGLVAYCAYLAFRFGDPLEFVNSQGHWHQAPGLATFFKIPLFEGLLHSGWSWSSLNHVMNPVIAIIALALVPQVFRRFGRPYGLYTLAVLMIPIIFTKDFFGSGRYVLAAFPCFAVVGERLATQRVGVRVVILAVSGLLLAWLTSLFARSYYVS